MKSGQRKMWTWERKDIEKETQRGRKKASDTFEDLGKKDFQVDRDQLWQMLWKVKYKQTNQK